MSEQWRPVVGYRDRYVIDAAGEIWGVDRRTRFVSKGGTESTRRVPARLIRPRPPRRVGGRIRIQLSRDGVATDHYLDVLIKGAWGG